ncbi:U11/U12 small nuclear ribonucleoprotein 48 kDa protein isoform X1 [Silene latifolia]|uniref:U11/U12 small nuclear ribonucleoprotein 48 kDa protein isoform X1 n=1 Tax=Silene latifolia TaxID=37657 RepID=UPI003D78220E
MNPQFTVSNSHFPFNPLNPNLNPNPQFNLPPPPPLHFQPPPLPPPPPPQILLPDLPNSISSLKTLIQSSNSTLNSLSSLLPSLSPSSKSLIQCPSNPNHSLPSTSLFLHSLTCPSPLDIGPLAETLQYPKTLKNDQHLVQGGKFFQPNDPTSELCFSIDDYVDFDTNFFYQDCPAVVSSSSSDVSKRMFTLPGVLSVECANFAGCGNEGSVVFGRNSVKVLPSEVWFVEREIEQWSDYPNGYSWSVGRAMLCVECVKECDLSMWVIENSPRFGVVIDAPMRDHLCVLFRLCLKAMVREATCSYESLLKSRIDDDSRNFNPRSSSFKCPVLVEVLRWLTSQLSILYGEMNSRSLVIALLRHLLSKAASNASLFPLDRKLDKAYGNDETTDIPRVQSSVKVTENEGNDTTYETIFSRPIFVYQIAAAIAALHERSLLEGRIRALRHSTHLTPYQRLVEHSQFSKKADEERQKRPDYRPLIEHDGLFNQRQHDQACNKTKTKEELLAEERDYKRRRMSYRGKKLKRSAKEVMRDMIEDYMEAIKPAGGIGLHAKGNPEVSVLTSTNSSAPAATSSKLSHSSRTDTQDNHRKLLDDDTKSIHISRRLEQHKKESYSHKYSDDQRTSRDRSDTDYYSRSPSNDRRHSRSRGPRSSSKERRRNRSRERRSHSRSQVVGENERSSRRLSISSRRKDKSRLQSPDRQRWKTHDYDKSDSFENVEINDRYDPSETSHTYDDQLDNSNYTRLTS